MVAMPSSDGDPVELRVEHDGLRIAALDWGGDGTPLLLLHPNGFCAGLFDPLARRLTGQFRPIGVDLRGHGGSDRPGRPEDLAFDLMAGDVAAVADHLGVERCVALGQSLGGAVAVLVDRCRPGLLSRLLLCEAVALSAGIDRDGPNPVADAARRRRAVFADRATMARAYRRRAPLSELAPDAMAAYLRWGTREVDGTGVALACLPETEAAIFELSPTSSGGERAWDHLASLSCPAVIVAGDRSSLPLQWFEAQAVRARSPLVVVPGGHFLLQADAARAATLVRDHLGR
jgi:pimeloyl-ACP methyl ester carboxylesterase